MRFKNKIIISIAFLTMLTQFNFAVKASDKATEKGTKALEETNSVSEKTKAEEIVEEIRVAPSKKVFLVTQKKASGKTFYDIGLAVNGKRVRVLYDKESPLNIEVTQHFYKGENKVSFFSVKQPDNGKIVKGKKEFDFKVLLFLAQVKNQSLEIEEKLIEYARNASETKRFVDEYVVELE